MDEKRKTVRNRYDAATQVHRDGQAIRRTISAAVAQGADPIEAFELGLLMCHTHSGKALMKGSNGDVIVKWGWFADQPVTELFPTTDGKESEKA